MKLLYRIRKPKIYCITPEDMILLAKKSRYSKPKIVRGMSKLDSKGNVSIYLMSSDRQKLRTLRHELREIEMWYSFNKQVKKDFHILGRIAHKHNEIR